MEAKDIRFAVIGCGKFGSVLVDALRCRITGATVTALVEPDENYRKSISEGAGAGLPIYRTLPELMANAPNLFDAVAIASANYQHQSHAICAAGAGKHIFCEKPMALSTDECVAMVRAAQSYKVRLMVGHNYRLRSAWRRLAELVSRGDLGTVTAVNINGWHHHTDIPNWWLSRSHGGGLLHRAGVHEIDYLNCLLGEPVWVSALAPPSARAGAEFSETLWVNVGYRSGAIGALQVSLWYVPIPAGNSFGVKVLGSSGSAQLSHETKLNHELRWGQTEPLRQERFAEQPGNLLEAHILELTSFVQWIRGDATPVFTWREGLRCVQVMEAAYQSAESDGKRVELRNCFE